MAMDSSEEKEMVAIGVCNGEEDRESGESKNIKKKKIESINK